MVIFAMIASKKWASIMIKCKTCQKLTHAINIFDGGCVDCMIKYSSDQIDDLVRQFYANCPISIQEEFKDPLNEFGGYIFDKREPGL